MRARVGLVGTDGTGLNTGTAQAAENGTFTMKDLAPGSYDLSLSGLPKGGYVKTVRYGGQDATRKALNVGSTGSTLDVIVATDGGEVTATVRDAEGRAVAGAAVSLWEPGGAPTDGSSRYAWNATSDASGGVKFQNVPPGEYRAAAWTGLEQGLMDAREFREQFAATAASVKLSASGQQSVDLKPAARAAVDAAVAKLP